MKGITISKVLIITGISLGMLSFTSNADAGHRKSRYHSYNHGYHHGYKHHKYGRSYKYKKHYNYYKPYHRKRYGHHGKIVVHLPYGSIKLSVGGSKYHYHKGHYYTKHHYGYTVVDAPIGACIARLPRGYRKVYYGHKPYYTYQGVYYKHTPEGYVVIPEPVHGGYSSKYSDSNESFTINVPTYSGGYTAVILTRKGSGFIGPQGEYYSEFPRIEQLKVMYGS